MSSPGDSRRTIARRRETALFLIAVPALLLLGIVFAWPVLRLLAMSVEGGTAANFEKATLDELYLYVLFDSVKIAAMVMGICLLIAYPVAFWLSRAGRWGVALGMFALLLPFWTSVLVRTYAWLVLLGRNGVVNRWLRDAGLIDAPLPLLHNTAGVLIGMVHVLLPYMVFPIYASLLRIDPDLSRAAEGLGAPAWRSFLRVTLPLSLPGVSAGCALVFVLSLGFFITPALLGGGRVIMVSMLIEQQVREFLDWPFAAALSTVLLVATLAIYALIGRITRGRAMRRRGVSQVLLGLFAGLVFLFLLLPLAVVFPISLSSAAYLQFPPPGFSWQWYQRYLDDPSWIDATIRSVKVASLCTVLAMALGVPLTFFLVRSRLPGVRVLDRLAAAPIIVPTIILSIALYGVFARLQLIGEWYGVAVAHTVLALPFVVILVSAGLRGFDEAQEQAAAGLGASWPAIIWRVTLPQLRPSLVSAAFLSFISSFDELVLAMFLSGASMTLPKKMFDNIMMEIDPTIAAVSVLQILLVAVALGLTSLFGRGALTTTITR